MSVHPSCMHVAVCVCVLWLRNRSSACSFVHSFQFRSFRRSCWETGRSVPSSAGCLCTSRPPASYGQTPRPLPAARSPPRSEAGRAPPHDTCRTQRERAITHEKRCGPKSHSGTSHLKELNLSRNQSLTEFISSCSPWSLIVSDRHRNKIFTVYDCVHWQLASNLDRGALQLLCH